MRSSLILFGLFSLAAGPARAFDDPSQFFASTSAPHAATLSASAEGIYFTGAPRFDSQTCSACHVDGPQKIGLRVGSSVPSLFTDGYQPGMTYELEVDLLNEVAGLKLDSPTCTEPLSKNDTYVYQPCNNNSFALEVDASDGSTTGVFCAAQPGGTACPPPDPHADEVVVAPNGDAVFANRAHSANPATPKLVLRNGPTRWHFWWTAPPAGSGPLALLVAAVDGNGGDGTSADDQDPYGDDTVQASVSLREAGAALGSGATAACAMAPPSRSSGGILLALALGALWLARRIRAGRTAARHPHQANAQQERERAVKHEVEEVDRSAEGPVHQHP